MSRPAKVALGLAGGALALALLLFTACLVLVLWGDPTFAAAPEVSREALAKAGISFDQPYASEVRTFRMSDGSSLRGQYLAAPDADTTVILIHGILGASFLLNETSGLLQAALSDDTHTAEVVAIDLRGHAFSDGVPGDVPHVGQYERDLGEVVAQLRMTPAGDRILLAGHSMGGGIALRYAEDNSLPPVDGYLLFAPYLGWEAPTTRRTAAPESQGSEAFMRVHLARIIGLKLLNAVGVTAFNGLRTQFFNLPPELPLRSYSFRAMESAAPVDAGRALRAVRVPLAVVVGSDDEAFDATQYEPFVTAHSKGRVVVVPGVNHNGVTKDPRAIATVREWAVGL